MSNRIYIETVHVRYIRQEPTENPGTYGLFIWDDYDHFTLLNFASEAEIPDTLEKILCHCLEAGYLRIWDFFVQNAEAEQCVNFDENYSDFEELKQMLETVARESEKGNTTRNA